MTLHDRQRLVCLLVPVLRYSIGSLPLTPQLLQVLLRFRQSAAPNALRGHMIYPVRLLVALVDTNRVLNIVRGLHLRSGFLALKHDATRSRVELGQLGLLLLRLEDG